MKPLYLRDDMEAEMDRLGYNQAQKAMTREFSQRGYVIIDPQISDTLIQDIIDQVEYPPDADRSQDAKVPAVIELAGNGIVIDALRALYGREPFPFQTLNFPTGTEQLTHSDTIHFDSAPQGFMAGVWVALEDIDENNGPIHYYPGSHRFSHLTLADLGAVPDRADYDAVYKAVYEPGVRQLVQDRNLTPEVAHMKKGQAFIWAANLLHGGTPILDRARSRHSQVTHYYFEDCEWFTPLLHIHRYPKDIRTGRRMGKAPLWRLVLNKLGIPPTYDKPPVSS